MSISRRTVLAGGLMGTAAIAVSAGPATARPDSPALLRGASAPLRRDPFTLGVASGDPWPDGFVIWTRLALDAYAPDGLGGMPDDVVPVQYEVAEDAGMRRRVRVGHVPARPRDAHTVHVTLSGLRPGRDYWYRFKVGTHLSAVGRARTAPAPGSMPATLAMAVASCSNWENGFFTAYGHLADEQPDVVLHLGDYFYENAVTKPAARPIPGPETTDLATYRLRHSIYKTDENLQAAHAAAPWIAVFDDHEVDNNWAGDMPEEKSPTKPGDPFLARRAAAFRAYYEHLPLRRSSIPRGIDMQLYRRLRWGRLATFHMMDTRQYRDDQACGDGVKVCTEADDPRRSLPGQAQERWLARGFADSTARWDLLGQQVFFARSDMDPAEGFQRNTDAWDGYAASRDRVQRSWVEAGVRNPVVLTGDVHRHWANDLKEDYLDPSSRIVGTELVTTSITSGGDGADTPIGSDPRQALNPHLRFYSNLRGYVRATITPDDLTADFRAVGYVTKPGAPVFTRASYRVHDRHPGLELLRETPLVKTTP